MSIEMPILFIILKGIKSHCHYGKFRIKTGTCLTLKKKKTMNYGYIRVSTDKQSVENQRHEINHFCQAERMSIDGWIEETTSGARSFDKRKLGRLLRKVKNGDLIICSELSRLGRSLFMIMNILSTCMEKGCRVWTVKDGYRLGDDIQSKVLAFAFGLSAEIERKLISERTRQALARLKEEGVHLGRPTGALNVKYRLDEHEKQIHRMIEQGIAKREIARRCKVAPKTLYNWLRLRLSE